MAQVLAIKSSILGDYSSSSLLIDELLAQSAAQDPSQEVVMRDLGAAPLAPLDGEILGAFSQSEGLNERQQAAVALSAQLIAEIEQADRVVIGVPMYNFGIPTQLKSWFDYICRAGISFKYTEQGPVGLLTDKPVLLVLATGGLHRDTATDLALQHVQTLLNFIGLHNIHIAYAQGLGMGEQAREQGLAQARGEIKNFLQSL